MLQLGGWTRQPHQCSHPTLSIPWLLCFYILPAKTATQKMQMSAVCGITRDKHWLHRQCESLFNTTRSKELFIYFYSADSHFNSSKPTRTKKFSVSKSSLHQMLPVHSETSTYSCGSLLLVCRDKSWKIEHTTESSFL